jgi:hypothetical protein
MASAVMVLGTAIGPILTGLLIDAGVRFDDQMIAVAGYFVLAAVCTALGVRLAHPALPARI